MYYASSCDFDTLFKFSCCFLKKVDALGFQTCIFDKWRFNKMLLAGSVDGEVTASDARVSRVQVSEAKAIVHKHSR